MKAYSVRDRYGYCEYSVIVFAETPGKAKNLALGTDEFPYGDWDFIELRATREPTLDNSYRGSSYMDWENMDDRVAMVKEAGYRCIPDYVELEICEKCPAKDWCGQYEEMQEEAEEMEDIT